MQKSVEDLLVQIKTKLPDFRIATKDLNFPTTEFLISYILNVLDDLGIDTEMIMMPPELQYLQNPEVYEEVMLPLKLYFIVRNFIPSNILKDFSVAPFINQKHSNDILWIQAVDNFHTFVVSRFKEMDMEKFMNKIKQDNKKLEEERMAIDEAKTMINERIVERSTRGAYTKELMEKITSLKASIDDKTALSDAKSQKITETIALNSQCDEQNEKLLAVITQLETKCNSLQDEIVENPVQLKEELEIIQMRNTELNEELETWKQKRITKKQQIKTLEQVAEGLENRIAQVNRIIDVARKLEVNEKEMNDVVHNTQQHTQNSTDANQSLADLKKRQKVIQDEFAEVKLQTSQTEMLLQKTLQELETTYKKEQTLYNENCQQVSDLTFKNSKLVVMQKEYKEEIQKTYSEFETTYAQIVEQGQGDLDTIANAVIKNLTQDI